MSNYHSYITIENLGDHIGKEVTLNGWVSDRTDKGKLCFVKLRDGSGIVQCVAFRPSIGDELFEQAKSLTQESSVSITGTVRAESRAPGGVEVDVVGLKIWQIAKF